MELSSLLFLLLQANLLFSAQSYCYSNGNYTPNSTYANNLNAALSSLRTNISNDGFYNASVGSRAPDRANAIAVCRGDAQLDECRHCVRNLTVELRAQCPNQSQAFQWREDSCTLRYSNVPLLGTQDMTAGLIMMNEENVTNPDEFMTDLANHLSSLLDRAASGSSTRKVATGNTTSADSQHIYAMVQCSPDLSRSDCQSCLVSAAQQIPGWRRGVRVMFPSCTVRYETYSFFNQTRLLELDHVPPTPQPRLAPQTPPASAPPPPSPGNNTRRTTIIIVLVSIAACVIVAVLVWIALRKRSRRKPKAAHYDAIDNTSTAESLKYELSTLRAATNDFSDDNKLGQGGFGSVYKGILLNGREIAVKRLSQNSGQGDDEFKNEVLLLAKLQHRNLVRLFGFCLEGMEKLLIYEFVENASLDHFIFDPIKRSYLEWEKRYKIIIGIARGILYLHEDSQVRIIHRDLKPSNVLLDGTMNPKIADFGMARLFGQDDTQGNTDKIVGTFGYMPPEYAMHGQFSVKSDVFSFGVLLLEIISGKKNNCVQDGSVVEDLLSFAWNNWRESTASNVVDPCLRSGSGSISDMVRCIHIGLLCVQENANDRPTMSSVVLMLNSHTSTMATPTEPAFFAPISGYGPDTSPFHEKNGGDSEYKNSSNNSIPTQYDNSSRNEISISDYYPR